MNIRTQRGNLTISADSIDYERPAETDEAPFVFVPIEYYKEVAMNHADDQSKALVAAACARQYHYSVYDSDGIAYKTKDGYEVFTLTEAIRFERQLQDDGLFAETIDIREMAQMNRSSAPTVKEGLKALWSMFWPLILFLAVLLPPALYAISVS
jgi:hypothetical protein